MRSFCAGVATTIVCGALALFVLWFAVAMTWGNPRVVSCVKDSRSPAVAVEIESNRKHGYFRTYHVRGCTAYFYASRIKNKS